VFGGCGWDGGECGQSNGALVDPAVKSKKQANDEENAPPCDGLQRIGGDTEKIHSKTASEEEPQETKPQKTK